MPTSPARSVAALLVAAILGIALILAIAPTAEELGRPSSAAGV